MFEWVLNASLHLNVVLKAFKFSNKKNRNAIVNLLVNFQHIHQHKIQHINIPFQYPLKNSENQSFSYVFRTYRNGTMVWKGLIFCF